MPPLHQVTILTFFGNVVSRPSVIRLRFLETEQVNRDKRTTFMVDETDTIFHTTNFNLEQCLP